MFTHLFIPLADIEKEINDLKESIVLSESQNDKQRASIETFEKAVLEKLLVDYPRVTLSENSVAPNLKKLIQLRERLNNYKEFDKKIDDLLNAVLEVDDFSKDIYIKIGDIETELDNLKIEMNLSDVEWEEDEN